MLEYPKTKRVNFQGTLGELHYEDPYIWLEEQQNKDVIQWTEAQNAYTEQWFKETDLQPRIRMLKAEQTEEDCAVCAELGEEVFVIYTDVSGQRSARIMTKNGELIRVLNPPAGGDVMTIVPDPFGSSLAVFVMMEKESCLFRFYIYDYREETMLAETPDLGEICWGKNQRLWYGTLNEAGTFQLRYYDCKDQESRCVYDLNRFAPYAVLRSDHGGKYIVADCKSAYTSGELLQIDQDTLEVQSLCKGCIAQFRYIGSKAGKHYIMTDWHAPRGQVISIEAGKDLRQSQTIVAESENVLLEAFLAGESLLACETEGMCARAVLYDLKGNRKRNVELPSETGTYGWRIGTEQIFAEHACYFYFEAFDTPPCMLRFNGKEESLSIWWQKKESLPSSDIAANQFFITARDGEKLPVIAIAKKDWKPDGKTPTLMTGYGGYRLVQPIPFQDPVSGIKPWRWAEQGGVYICCGLRGGGEYGLHWHEAGCGIHKKNAFYDFIDTAKWLIKENWTCPEKLAACGASNGGLLVTAATAMEPDLWACAIASVPHTDMLRFIYDAAGPGYATEYGDPREKGMAEYMCSYSPYHQAGKEISTPIYLQTGERDPQVPSYHAKKLAAALQHGKKGGPTLLRTLKKGTHDRGAGEEYYRTIAEMQSFLSIMLGLEEETKDVEICS